MTTALIVQEPLPAAPIPSAVDDLLRAAVEHNTPVETMERLLAMRRELRAEAAEESYNRALAAFQAECPKITKRREVMQKGTGAVRYRFAALSDILAQLKELLEKHGFSHEEDAIVEDGWVIGVCTVHHVAGHSRKTQFKAPVDKDAFMSAPQKYASAFTYAKRYAFCGAFGIMTADQDDDAQAAAQQEAAKPNSQDKIRELKKRIWDTMKAKFTTKQALQQHLWDENLMPLDMTLETASVEVLERIAR